ncbi:glucocorticoid modulatory element-binding protein 1-like isoform X2 [Nelusetta ayraudi]|uniref:glucocorticoid modulatory element-binding protein 1-like isoform X2 n=1 Tax=Nelusetta ayraudi TaxID=303726 RepID=UPI003F72985B
MAGAEVTVSPGHLLTVKEEEGESSGNNHKAQVILHLQPILHGTNDDTADRGTTVLAIETKHENNRTDGDEIEYGYPITCGDSRAVLLFKKFVCPGINVRCVKFNDQLISPKQFVHLAGKATLKDWKRAIRLGGVMLRKMMDSGQIDFYQHDTVCSNTCRSTKFDVLINSARFPPGTLVQPSLSCLALDHLGGQVPPLTDGVLSLWRSVADSGLMGEVLSSLQTELLATLKGVELRSVKAHLQEADAIVLNTLCKMFGLLDSVKQALDLKRCQEEEHKIHNGNYMLDEILDDQRKQGRVKNASCKMKPFKQSDPLCHSEQNKRQSHDLLSQVRPGIQPPFAAALSTLSFAQLPIDPQLHVRVRGAAENRKEVSGIRREPGQRTVKSDEDLYPRSEETDETRGLRDFEKIVSGRKASKKHKSK